MSLFDVDKNSVDRGSPNPSRHDQIIDGAVKNHNTTSINPTADATVLQRIAFKGGLILTYDDVGRVSSVYGYVPGLANYPVLIIANYGYDVYTDILGLTAPTV